MDREHIRKSLDGYKNKEETVKEILQVLNLYRGLSCHSTSYVFNDGRCQDLGCLEGTIPVSFKGIYYNIPISISLMKTHPTHPPMCFVKPTCEMNIKVSMYVDHSGKIYLPYLHEWTPTKSDLMGLIQVMIVTFGDNPPVFSKPKTEALPATPYPQQAYMPMPGVGVGSRYAGYPPGGSYGVGGQGTTSYPAYTSQPAPYPQPSYPPAQPQQHVPTSQDTTPSSASNNSGTITEEHIKVSLLSAIEHKVKRRLEEQTAQQKAELEILKHTGLELSQGKVKIQSLFDKLNREKMELERNITILKEKDSELEKSIGDLKEENDVDVDEAVTTTAPLYKQIVNSYAEEAATEDAIYYMGEALRRGIIDLDVFLKQVRSLSRKQFMLRALMQKCRLKAGLAG